MSAAWVQCRVRASGRYVAYTWRPTQGNDEPVVQVVDLTAAIRFADQEPGDVETAVVPGVESETEASRGSIGFLGDDLVVSARDLAYLWKRGEESKVVAARRRAGRTFPRCVPAGRDRSGR